MLEEFMGFFNSISNAIREAQDKARLETMQFTEKMNAMDMSAATRLAHSEYSRGRSQSISYRSSVIQAFHRKLASVDDSTELYHAFEDMYYMYKRRSDALAGNLAMKIGKKLYTMGDNRIQKIGDDNIYAPKGW